MKISQEDKLAIEQIIDRVGGGPGMRGILKSCFFWSGVSPRTGKLRRTIFKKGHYWIAKSAEEWGDEANIKGTTARKLLTKLKAAGIIEKEVWYYGHFKKIHVRLVNEPNLTEAETVPEYRMPEKTTGRLPVEDHLVETVVPDASGTLDRLLYKQVQASTNTSTRPEPESNCKSHPQTELSEKWQNLESALRKTATDRTIQEFKSLIPKALPAGKIIVYGHCSEHLMRLIRAKFGAIEFLAA